MLKHGLRSRISWKPSRIIDLETYFGMVVSRLSYELSDAHSCLDKVSDLELAGTYLDL